MAASTAAATAARGTAAATPSPTTAAKAAPNKLLFVANQGDGSNILVDAIDTSTNLVKGAQQKLGKEQSLGTRGWPGYAVLVAKNSSGAGVVYSLEPSNAALPAGFVPDTYEQGTDLDSTDQIIIFGHDETTNALEIVGVRIPGVEGPAPTVGKAKPIGELFKGKSIAATAAAAASVKDVYITAIERVDGGSSLPKSIYHVHLPAL